ncbi:MAG TPA: glycosyltransferase [Patescibacteria group bacterium]|nr:glycosyltransferase [Patescibacteria group bacterium]
MKKDLVSIVIPARNEEKNIGRLLDSIKKQSYKRIETIVVDDGSSDKTINISKQKGAKVFQRAHLERSAQRNFGASKAKGKYLIFLDADMELTKKVVEDCVSTVFGKYKLLVIPEKTVGNNFIARIRNFEREMYMGDFSIEVARFFEKKIFEEYGGYDLELTGPEDYDLPYRIGKQYEIGRSGEYILHHEEGVTLYRLLKKKYYYGRNGAKYAKKHPELIATQGNLLFRKAYFRNWKKFVNDPVLGFSFVIVRTLEATWAVAGYLSSFI